MYTQYTRKARYALESINVKVFMSTNSESVSKSSWSALMVTFTYRSWENFCVKNIYV